MGCTPEKTRGLAAGGVLLIRAKYTGPPGGGGSGAGQGRRPAYAPSPDAEHVEGKAWKLHASSRIGWNGLTADEVDRVNLG